MNVFFTIMLLQLKAAEWITEILPVNGRFTRQGAAQGGNWRGVWGRMDACVCVAEFLHCPPETIATLFINVILLLTGYIPIQNKKLKKERKERCCDTRINKLK